MTNLNTLSDDQKTEIRRMLKSKISDLAATYRTMKASGSLTAKRSGAGQSQKRQGSAATKRPKDMTSDELEALPDGPGAVRVDHSKDDDLGFHLGKNGQGYTFGQWADGRWYKEPFAL